MKNSELFWNADLGDLKRGYMEEEEHYLCLLCGHKIEKGIIYQAEDIFYEAEKYMKVHISKAHNSVFDYLIRLNKKLTGLTDHQNRLLRLFFQGKSDTEIQNELEIGSASTIRHHRFVFKEKERQAKMFLTLMELIKEKDEHAPAIVQPHKTATMVDDRYNVTEEVRQEIIAKCFPEGVNGQLEFFPSKQKQKLVVLQEISKHFSMEQTYSEKDLNDILKAIFEDYVLLRRYLIEYGFMDRKADGSEYWLKK